MTRRRSNRSGFEQRLLATLREIAVPAGARLSVAFSGGTDSLALAHALTRIAPLLDLHLLLIHVDHRLRPSSSEDAIASRALAAELGLPIEVVTLDDGLRARADGIGLEEVARRERYAALAAVASDWDSSSIVLAHHANDQAETVLMHLFRGAGLDGLTGMHLREERNIPWWRDSEGSSRAFTLLRPLLREPQVEMEAYLDAAGVTPLVDESNVSLEFDRNWVRHRVLPDVLERWPGAVTAIQRASEVLDHDRLFLEEQTGAGLIECRASTDSLSRVALLRLHPALRQRVLRAWLLSQGVEEVAFDAVVAIDELVVDGDNNRVVEVGDVVSVVLDGDRVTPFHRLLQHSSLRIPMDVGGWIVDLASPPGGGDVILNVPEAMALSVRTIRQGDCWHGTNRAVKEDLRAAGIHPLLRTRILAVVTDDGVLLIPAIYPTIRTAAFGGPTKQVGVRWNRES